jgi:hypothetical protein
VLNTQRLDDPLDAALCQVVATAIWALRAGNLKDFQVNHFCFMYSRRKQLGGGGGGTLNVALQPAEMHWPKEGAWLILRGGFLAGNHANKFIVPSYVLLGSSCVVWGTWFQRQWSTRTGKEVVEELGSKISPLFYPRS